MGIILENLVLNAMEAAGGRGRPVQVAIRVSAAENPGFQIECTDNGPGIPSALLPERLFEPFVSARPGGSGIGLWQVKRLVESLGGEISARNGQSGGARFLLLFHMGCRMPEMAGHTRHPEAPAYRGQKL
jgi:signal transduction histidine kinase